MEAFPGTARVENTPRLPQLQDYRHVLKKGALFRRVPALKRVTWGGLEGGCAPLQAGMEGGRCPLRSWAPRNIRANCVPVGVSLDSTSPHSGERGRRPTGHARGKPLRLCKSGKCGRVKRAKCKLCLNISGGVATYEYH